jgi:hypothetical protein
MQSFYSAMQSDAIRCNPFYSSMQSLCNPMQSDAILLRCDAIPLQCDAILLRCDAIRYNPFAVRCNPFKVRCNPFAVRCNPFAVRCNPMQSDAIRCCGIIKWYFLVRCIVGACSCWGVFVLCKFCFLSLVLLGRWGALRVLLGRCWGVLAWRGNWFGLSLTVVKTA